MTAGIVEPAIILLVFIGALCTTDQPMASGYVHASPRLLASAASVVLILAFAFSLTVWTSVWQARARDTRFALRYVVSFWLYFTPVIYPMSLVPANIRWLMHQSTLGADRDVQMGDAAKRGTFRFCQYSMVVTLVTFAGGVWYFAHAESATMDKI